MTESRGIYVRRGTRQTWAEEQADKHQCGCGCGQAVKVRPEHFPNVPKYLHGHNGRMRERKPALPRVPCACGCGELASPGRKYISGHSSRGRIRSEAERRAMSERMKENNPFKGRRPHNSKGGRIKTKRGYIELWMPDHPAAKSERYILEHRYLMERHLLATDPGSEFLEDGVLHPMVDVHHRNHVKDDNRIENLQAMWKSEHAAYHRTLNPPTRLPDEWFDGEEHDIVLGKDTVSSSMPGLRSSIHRAGKRRGFQMVTAVINPTTVRIRAVPPK